MDNFRGLRAGLSRRGFLAGMAAVLPQPSFAAEAPLTVTTRILEVKGRAATVYGISGWERAQITYGERFSVSVNNALAEDTLLHWHGLTPPSEMDGVPMLSGPVLKPGETRLFSFDNTRTGTHWMHSHVGLQEQKLLAAPLVVKEAGEALVDEQEHVVMLHDFTFREPAEILAELQSGGGAHAAHAAHGAAKDGHNHTHGQHTAAGAGMAADVNYDAMLANDRTLDDPEIVVAEKGGRFRLRIINGAAATNFWIDLGALEGELIAVDGNGVYPVKGKRFPLAIAQRADIRLSLPAGPGAYPILFQAEGAALRSGIVLKAGNQRVKKLSDTGKAGAALDLTLEAELRSVAEIPDEPVSRIEMVMLEGGGSDYVWRLNGKSDMHHTLFSVKQGERIDIMMHNMTNMAHPMHLHGHYFKVVDINGQKLDGALRDTVLVPVNAMVTVRFDASNPGTWAFHCHHAYHMNSGMMGAIAYTNAA